MRATLFLHILAGTLGLIAGYVALYSAKGAMLHRRSGRVFVYAMLTMCVGGLLIAVVRSVAPEINIPAALLTSYLIITALTTVKPLPIGPARSLAVAALLVAASVAAVMLTFAGEAIADGGKRNGMPAFPFIMFGTIALLGTLGDLRVLRSGQLKGASRLARHLWRMSFALFIAALSFSVQLAKMIPKPVRIPVLVIPMLAVLATMIYWLWRVRVKRSLRGMVGIAAAEAA